MVRCIKEINATKELNDAAVVRPKNLHLVSSLDTEKKSNSAT